MKEVYEKYLANKREITKLQEENDKILINLFIRNEIKIAEKEGDGTVNIFDGDYKITFIKKSTVTVDQNKAKLVPHLFKVKYDYNKTLIKELDNESIKQIEDCITVKPAKPSLSIEVRNENK